MGPIVTATEEVDVVHHAPHKELFSSTRCTDGGMDIDADAPTTFQASRLRHLRQLRHPPSP